MYPALSVLQALTKKDESVRMKAEEGKDWIVSNHPSPSTFHPLEVLWVGGIGGMETDLVKRAGVPFEAISAAGVHGVGLRALPGNLWLLGRGYRQAQRIVRRFRPDVLFFTGGYVGVPVALAGRKIPSGVYVPDIEPGLALKVQSRFASRIAVSTEDSRQYFSPNAGVTITGYPTRPDLSAWNLGQAQRFIGLSADLPTLLVFGGSRGARSINQALLSALPALLKEMQVIHISGQPDWPEVEVFRSEPGTGRCCSLSRLPLPARDGRSAGGGRPGAYPGRRLYPGRVAPASACQPSWCHILMPGVTSRPTPSTWPGGGQLWSWQMPI